MGLLGGEDVFSKSFSLECKSRRAFTGEKWMKQCIANNKDEKIPVVVIHVANKAYNKDMVLINRDDFIQIADKACLV